MIFVQTAIITGANRGIGFALAKTLARKGFRVVLACRNKEKAEQAVDKLMSELGVSSEMLVPVACDLTDERSMDVMCEYLREKIGKVDILINNAGILLDKNKKLLGMNMSDFKDTHLTNYFGVYYLTSKILPGMIKDGSGRIVMISSGGGQIANLIDDMPSYRLSKFALNGLTIMLADIVKETGVRVFACDPGWVRTAMGGEGAEKSPEEAASTIVELLTSDGIDINGRLFCNGAVTDW